MAPSHPRRRGHRAARADVPADPAQTPAASTAVEWLSLTDLGRIYGISAVQTGRLLVAAGLRESNGEPSAEALTQGLAVTGPPRHHHHSALWSRQGCGPVLERDGLLPMAQRSLLGLWAELLSTLQRGTPGISTSAEEMATEVPLELVRPVNQALRQLGSSFQVKRPGAHRAADRAESLRRA
ncbi:MAG: hypothetical protein ACOVNL_07155 [Prochlorococcaceae cyanobacterium]|jgi:hypothetical protein